MREALSSSETSVFTRATRLNIPEETILHSHRRENLKSYMFSWFSLVLPNNLRDIILVHPILANGPTIRHSQVAPTSSDKQKIVAGDCTFGVSFCRCSRRWTFCSRLISTSSRRCILYYMLLWWSGCWELHLSTRQVSCLASPRLTAGVQPCGLLCPQLRPNGGWPEAPGRTATGVALARRQYWGGGQFNRTGRNYRKRDAKESPRRQRGGSEDKCVETVVTYGELMAVKQPLVSARRRIPESTSPTSGSCVVPVSPAALRTV
jgi:hypothetical protein